MQAIRISLAFLILGILATVSQAASADTLLLASPLLVVGGTDAGTPQEGRIDIAPSTPLPYSNSQSLQGSGYVSTSTYNFTQTDFRIDLSRSGITDPNLPDSNLPDVMEVNSGEIGNNAESRGSIFFSLSTTTEYALTGQLDVQSLNLTSGASGILGAIYDENGQPIVNISNDGNFSPVPLVLGGAYGYNPSSTGFLTGSLDAGTYEFRYSAFIQATDQGTAASATGFLNLHLGPPIEQPAETPLPTVATAGVALLGVLGLRRPRR